MSFAQLNALTKISTKNRGLGWIDMRNRSPKALSDLSGVILSGGVTARGGFGQQNFNYELLSKIYLCNDMAWSCINLVSSTAAMAKLKVRIRKGNTFTYVPNHPLQAMLDFPNNSMTQFDLIQAYVTHQLLFGTVTLLLLREGMKAKCPICDEAIDGWKLPDCTHKLFFDTTSPVAEIMPIHPSNITQKSIMENGVEKKYFFYIPNGASGLQHIIHPDNLITDPFYNPDVSWYGVSPTFLLKRWLDLDHAMTSQIHDFFENGAIPSMIVSMTPGSNYTYEQEPETLMDMMKQKWMERFSANSKTAKAPAFVYGDIKVQRLQEKIEETISKGIYYEIQNRILATYGVPPTMYEMGLRYATKGGSATYSQHEKDFFNNTITKILTRFKSKINHLVIPTFNTPGLEVDWDLGEMGIASFLTDARDLRITKHWELGLLQRDTTRQLLGYEPVGGEFGDDFYRLTVMSDGSNSAQASGMDNRLAVAQNENLPVVDATNQ